MSEKGRRRAFISGTGRVVTEATVERVSQRIDEPIGSELNFLPSKVQRYFTDNIFSRSLSYLFGWTPYNEPVRLRATELGVLKVTDVGGGYTQTETKYGLATVNWSDVKEFSFTPVRVIAQTKDYPYYIAFSPDGARWTTAFYVAGDMPLRYDVVARYFKVRKAFGSDARYIVTALA